MYFSNNGSLRTEISKSESNKQKVLYIHQHFNLEGKVQLDRIKML